MSTLSKFFVGLNFVLAMIFMTASLALYAKKVNWLDEARESGIARNKYYKDLKALQATYERTKSDKDQKIAEQADQIKAVTDANNRLEQANRTLNVQLSGLNEKYTGINTSIEQLKENLTVEQNKNRELQTNIDLMRNERDKAVAAREFAESTAIEAISDGKELEQQYLQASKRIRELIVQNEEMKIALDKLQTRTGVNVADLGMSVSATMPDLRGRVLQVDEAVGLVILNVGAKDQVSQGMEFLISRDGKYLGKVRVRRIDQEMSSAIIDRPTQTGKIEISDVAQIKR